jgi:hypothetical protein
MNIYRPLVRSSVLAALAAVAAACGSVDPGDGDGPEEDGGTPARVLLPLATGNSWTFRVTDGDTVETKVQTVGEREPVGGSGPHASVLAFRVTTERGTDGSNETVSYQATVGSRVVRYREQAFNATTGDLDIEEYWDPYKLRVEQAEEFLEDGASFLETYDETKLVPGDEPTTATRSDRWTVLAAREMVTVPAGTFEALKVSRVSSSQGAVKTYWFVENVGKVKEDGGQLEELESYEVAE